MFSNRIGFGPRLGAALLDLVFPHNSCRAHSLLGIGAGLAAALAWMPQE